MKEIDEGGRPRPHPPHVWLLTVALHDEDVSLESVLVGWAAGLDAGIDDGYVVVLVEYFIESV